MKLSLKKIVIGLLVIALAVGAYMYFGRKSSGPAVTYKTPEEQQNVYVRFDMEGYDQIVQNYWNKTDDASLSQFFQLSLQKALGTPVVPTLATTTREGTAEMLAAAMKAATSTDAEKALAVNTLIVALYNLPPVGHDQLLSQQQETALRNDVSNVNPGTNLYGDLGLAKGASASDVQAAYTAKAATLKNATSTADKAELKQIAYADKVLTDPNTKDLYDQAQIEPTISHQVIGHTLYIDMSKVSPTSFLEFGRTIVSASTTPGLDSMIIDLRGNLGGALDFSQNFLGLFLGDNQYIYDLYHQGDYNVQRTLQPKFDELDRYKDIAVLIDGMTQSTAEITSSVMERFHLAHIVGVNSRGWGTVENTFPLTTVIDPTESYSMLLVHSLTLGADEQPIQDKGVAPDVNITDPNWKSELSTYFTSPSLISALKQVAGTPRTDDSQ